jgi:MoaA/NifB/PqqE/SkfB family radical SAM enzyme
MNQMEHNQPEAIKVYFEVTNHCNFGCDFCPIHESGRKRQHMDFALFQKGVNEMAAQRIATTVGFHVLGEPLLYPQILDALRYANGKGLRTELHTNGALLTTERIQALTEARLDSLSISVQMLDKEEHKCRGTRMPFEQYYQRVMGAVRFIRGTKCQTEVTLCAMNTSTARLFDIDRRMRVNGKASAFKANLAPFLLDLHAAIDRPVSRRDLEMAVRRLGTSRPRVVCLDERVKVYVHPFADWGNAFTSQKVYPAKIGYCGYSLSNLGILSNGEVTICCADYDGRTSLGNLATLSLASMLSSQSAQAIRSGFNRLRVVHPYCQRCIGSTNRLKAVAKGLVSICLFRILDFQPAKVKETPFLKVA